MACGYLTGSKLLQSKTCLNMPGRYLSDSESHESKTRLNMACGYLTGSKLLQNKTCLNMPDRYLSGSEMH